MSADQHAARSARQFVVTTRETVEGTYLVTAESEEAARAKFDRQPGRLIDWAGVDQTDYMAYEVEIDKVYDHAR